MQKFLTTEDDAIEKQADENILALSIRHPSTFSIIVDRYEAPFMRKALRILKNKDDAQDVVQETFTKIYINAKRFKKVPGASFKSWGYKILVNTAFTSYKKLHKEKNARVYIGEEVYENMPDTSIANQDTSMLNDYIASIISKMPQSLGMVLRLHFLEDKAHKEIAEIEGVSISAIKTRVHRAKKEFRVHSKTLDGYNLM